MKTRLFMTNVLGSFLTAAKLDVEAFKPRDPNVIFYVNVPRFGIAQIETKIGGYDDGDMTPTKITITKYDEGDAK